ncbi:hypothetical protein [Streptodolium elevatio]|uniref:DNMP kinase n=1 Tax=Streptodolium elevatio TaxID=3157996 RepID=A0ABV3DDH8_9ACTN
MNDFLIGLSGYARSGKDEAAKALVAGGWRQVAFADKVKDFVCALDPMVPSTRGGQPMRLSTVVARRGWDYAKTWYPEVRVLLQRAGTEAGRRILGQDIWIDALFRDIAEEPAVVISDVRFPNEAQAIADRGGLLIRIERPGVGVMPHESETALDDWPFDHVLVNDGTVEDLHRKVVGATILTTTGLMSPTVC